MLRRAARRQEEYWRIPSAALEETPRIVCQQNFSAHFGEFGSECYGPLTSVTLPGPSHPHIIGFV
jgi:hypothetical protein